MAKLTKPGIHALKMTKRMGRVKMVSLTFDGPGARSISNEFKLRFQKALARQTRQHGQFALADEPDRIDWFVIFKGTWPEKELNVVLNGIATELGGWMYMAPARPLREMSIDPKDYMFLTDPVTERRTN